VVSGAPAGAARGDRRGAAAAAKVIGIGRGIALPGGRGRGSAMPLGSSQRSASMAALQPSPAGGHGLAIAVVVDVAGDEHAVDLAAVWSCATR
jgi:hypothetical protein